MKLYAQLGHGDAEKTTEGLREGVIDGAIISPRNVKHGAVIDKIDSYKDAQPDSDILLDPQFYATFLSASDTSRMGSLTDWPYFETARTRDLELTPNVESVLRRTFECEVDLPVTAIIAPNIYVSRSFDSREAVIAKNFIRSARNIYDSFDDERPLLVTLAVSREALLERSEFEELLNELTLLADPPDGFYILVGSRGTDAHTDIFHADVIARWMLLNHSLAINGFEVVNGYSDLLTPFLGAVGGSAGATGWWSNLRVFSLDRFLPGPGGGRQPIARYVSIQLMNRITFTEKEALETIVPSILNGLTHDGDYTPEPDRTSEILQSWEALQQMNSQLVDNDIDVALEACNAAVTQAENTYYEIMQAGLTLDRKSGDDHLAPLGEGIEAFREMAGLP